MGPSTLAETQFDGPDWQSERTQVSGVDSRSQPTSQHRQASSNSSNTLDSTAQTEQTSPHRTGSPDRTTTATTTSSTTTINAASQASQRNEHCESRREHGQGWGRKEKRRRRERERQHISALPASQSVCRRSHRVDTKRTDDTAAVVVVVVVVVSFAVLGSPELSILSRSSRRSSHCEQH